MKEKLKDRQVSILTNDGRHVLGVVLVSDPEGVWIQPSNIDDMVGIPKNMEESLVIFIPYVQMGWLATSMSPADIQSWR